MKHFTLGVLATLACASSARAVETHVSSEIVGQGYQLLRSDGDAIRRSRLNLLLGLDVVDMTGDGSNLVSFVSQFRFDTDFGYTDIEEKAIPAIKNNQLSLQYVYVDVRRLAGAFDLRIGRQLLIDDMDYTMMDGIKFIYHTPLYYGIEVEGGLEVRNAGFLESISATQLESDGTEETEDKGIVIGGSVFLEGLRDHQARVGYRRIMTPDGDIDAERVYADYHIRVIPELHLAVSGAWDFVIGDVNDVRAEVRSPSIAGMLDIEASYWRLLPSFSGASIFNVFSTEPINDVDLRFRFHFTPSASAYAGPFLRLFGNDKDDNDTIEDEGVKDIGVRAGGRIAFANNARIGLDVSWQSGYGDLTVIDLDGGYGFLDDTLRLDGRVTTLVYEDALLDRLQTTSFGGQLGVSYLIRNTARFHVMNEVNVSKIEKLQYRVMGLVDLDFWL